MSEGRLRCCGSSLFLKKTYGVGYQLTIEKLSTKAESTTASIQDGMQANDTNLHSIVTTNVREASLLSNVGSELSYQLPMGAASKFTPMFEGLDEEIDNGNISSYGVSITTLDEVFLLVARGENKEKHELASSKQLDGSVGRMATDADKSNRSRMDLENEKLFMIHLGALFRKRAANFRRDKKAWCCTTILPSAFVLIGLVIFLAAAGARNLSPLQLTLEDYNPNFGGTPRNPIVFNAPASRYQCQPGSCAYQVPVVLNPTNDEKYFFCGYQARLNDTEQTCTIAQSEEVVSRLNGIAGASAQGTDVSAVGQVSVCSRVLCWNAE
jgi:ATP-binding cassette, subfamily A (ABC1), member 3